jgi:hypothetical protein
VESNFRGRPVFKVCLFFASTHDRAHYTLYSSAHFVSLISAVSQLPTKTKIGSLVEISLYTVSCTGYITAFSFIK